MRCTLDGLGIEALPYSSWDLSPDLILHGHTPDASCGKTMVVLIARDGGKCIGMLTCMRWWSQCAHYSSSGLSLSCTRCTDWKKVPVDLL